MGTILADEQKERDVFEVLLGRSNSHFTSPMTVCG